MAESSFDSFGDFGEFQSATASTGSLEGDGTLTPTGADSWSFASISSTGSEEGSVRLSESPQDKETRTA